MHEWDRESQTPPTVTKVQPPSSPLGSYERDRQIHGQRLKRELSPTQTRYSLSLCSPLPDPSGDAPDDDCPAGTRLCMRTFTSRPGLDDRILSVVPIVSNDADALTSKHGSSKTKDEWIFEMGGGKYNDIDQRVKIDFKCDPSAKEVR